MDHKYGLNFLALWEFSRDHVYKSRDQPSPSVPVSEPAVSALCLEVLHFTCFGDSPGGAMPQLRPLVGTRLHELPGRQQLCVDVDVNNHVDHSCLRPPLPGEQSLVLFSCCNLSAASGLCFPGCSLAHTSSFPREGRESAPGCAPGGLCRPHTSTLLSRWSLVDCTSRGAEVVPLGGSCSSGAQVPLRSL